MLESRQGMLFKTVLRGEQFETLERFVRAKRLLASRVESLEWEVHHLKSVPHKDVIEEAVRLVVVCVLLAHFSEVEDESARQAGDDDAVANRSREIDDEWDEIKTTLHETICSLYCPREIYSSAWSHIVKIGLGNEVHNVKRDGLDGP